MDRRGGWVGWRGGGGYEHGKKYECEIITFRSVRTTFVKLSALSVIQIVMRIGNISDNLQFFLFYLFYSISFVSLLKSGCKNRWAKWAGRGNGRRPVRFELETST